MVCLKPCDPCARGDHEHCRGVEPPEPRPDGQIVFGGSICLRLWRATGESPTTAD